MEVKQAQPDPLQCKVVGGVPSHMVDQVRLFLSALSFEPPEAHDLHELVLTAANGKPVTADANLKLQHVLPKDVPRDGTEEAGSGDRWAAVYEGVPFRNKAAQDLNALIRQYTYSKIDAADVTKMLLALGYTVDYEALKRGYQWQIDFQGRTLQVVLYALHQVHNGQLHTAIPVHSDYWLIEVSTIVTDGQPAPACQQLEQVRSSQREINRGCRDIEREVLALKREEQKLIREIKSAAAKNNTAGARALAKQLVRIRNQIQRLTVHNAQLKGISAQVTTAAATATVGSTMATTTKVMEQMGKTIDPVKMQGTLKEFSMQNERMNMASEMMNDAIDDALDDDEIEDETEDIVGQVLDEIGIDLSAQMRSAPGQKVAGKAKQQQQEASDEEADAVLARLAALK